MRSTLDQVVRVRALARDIVLQVFLGKILYSQSASLHPGVQMGTSKFNAGVTLGWTSIPSRGSRDIPGHRNRGKLLPGGPLGS